ncbi:2-acyl-glycerophospho-ethanolamine acyltransferase [compost metagenome]
MSLETRSCSPRVSIVEQAKDMQGLLLNHSIQRLSTAYFFSKCGEFAFEAAFAVAVVTLAEANFLLIGLVYFFRYLPCALFSPLGGWLADNCVKKNTLVMAELAKIFVAGLLFVVFEFAYATVTIVTILSMLLTALDCIYAPTFRAYFPDVVSDDKLAVVNSGVQVIEDSSSIIGPLIFSLIAILLSPSFTFAFFAFCLMLSAACALTLVSIPKKEKASLNVLELFKEAGASVGDLRSTNAPLFAVICCTTFCAIFATSIIRFILPASVLETFQSEAAVGYVFSLLAIGTVIGSMLYVRFNRITTARSVIKYWTLYGVIFLMAAIALEFNVYVFLVLLLFTGFIGAFVDIAIVTNIQSLSGSQQVGRNFSLYYFTAVLGDALSGLVASLMFVIVGPATFIGMTFMLSIAPLRWSLKRDEGTNKDRAERVSRIS